MEEPEDVRYEAYASLLDTAVRKAWVWPPVNADKRVWTNTYTALPAVYQPGERQTHA